MLSDNVQTNSKKVKGWIFDVYPSSFGEITVWIIGENGERIRLTDKFRPIIYISGNEEDIERLACRIFSGRAIVSIKFVHKYASVTDTEKSKVLEVVLKDCRQISSFTRDVLEMGRYLKYRVHNCDLHGDQAYIYDRDIFPFGFVEAKAEKSGLKYSLIDSVGSVDYQIPPLRTIKILVEIAKKGKIPNFNDPVDKIFIDHEDHQTAINVGSERAKLLQLVHSVKELDPDIVLTSGGDSYVFPYLVRRAAINDVLDEFNLSRDNAPLDTKQMHGRTFFSYGRTYYRAPMRRLYGRIHIDENNTFILSECGIEGLIEVARTCRVPLHRASRASIGSSMSSLQFYQAIKDDILIPRNKSIPEAFKSAYELLVGDRGGFIYEPIVGIHDCVGEVDFASMYPTLMANNNISAETVLCRCCPDSHIRIPELGYHICEKRIGIVPKTLGLIIAKRRLYKQLKQETPNQELKEIYDRRQVALKWISVTCFGYLGYANAKFGTVDGHMGVCAFGRDAFLRAAHIAEKGGFTIVHGIVDSLWLKKEDATIKGYIDLCKEISSELKAPLSFEGRYKWIVFLPSKLHPNVGVLNRYYGAMEDGKIKVRGIEIRRRDTPKVVCEAQMEMIKVLASANNSKEFVKNIPDALKVIREYREKLLNGEIPVWDFIITKHLSKHPREYKQKVSQVIAAEQLIKEGAEVHAGKNIRFLFTNAENKHYERRVKAEKLVETNTNPDIRKYLLLLYASAANLLSPFGYSVEDIYDTIRGYQHAKITSYQR